MTVTEVALTIPSGHRFGYDGTVTWIAVSKKNLKAKYRLQLYRYNQLNGEYTPVGDAVETDKSYYSFKSAILSDIENVQEQTGEAWDAGSEIPYSYSYTIQTIPITDNESTQNYGASPISDKKTVEKKKVLYIHVSYDENTIDADKTYAREYENGYKDFRNGQSFFIIAGGTVTLSEKAKEGYELEDQCWKISDSTVGHINKIERKDEVTGKTRDDYVFYATSYPTNSKAITLQCFAKDEEPKVISFEGKGKPSDLSKVILSAKAIDSRKLTKWAIVKRTDSQMKDEELEDGSFIQVPQEPSNAEWNDVTEADSLLSDEHEISVRQEVDEAGAYYLWLADDGGNIIYGDRPVNVYQISFAKGNDDVQTITEMPTILKVENQSVTIPALGFDYEGYVFKNWSGKSGIYADEDYYLANESDILTATWTDEQYEYEARYYFMGTDGKYANDKDAQGNILGEDPEIGRTISTVTIKCAYGYHIQNYAAHQKLRISKTGFSYETDLPEEKKEDVIVKDNSSVVSLYYKRAVYQVKYQYQVNDPQVDPSDRKTYTCSTEDIYYGTKMVEKQPPVSNSDYVNFDGYTFVGWLYNGADMPKNMPGQNLVATGVFVPKSTKVIIQHLLQNLAGKDYVLNDAFTTTLEAKQGDIIAFSTSDENVREIEGFSIESVAVNHHVDPEKDNQEADQVDGKVFAVSSNELVVSYRYSRNSYPMTLKLWKGSRSKDAKPEKEILVGNFKYGTIFDSSQTNLYENYNKGEWPEYSDYRIADYADWSTGEPVSSMPAGPVNISRDYVKKGNITYIVELYLQDATGDYVKHSNLAYYAPAGSVVTISDNPHSDTNISFDDFKNAIYGFDHYEYNSNHPLNHSSVRIVEGENGEKPVLRAYFSRKEYKTTITYYMVDEDHTKDNAVKIGQVVKKGKFDSKYKVEPLALFYGSGDSDSNAGTYWQDIEAAPFIGTVGSESAKDYSFFNNKYVVSYSYYYKLNDDGSYGDVQLLDVAKLNNNHTQYFGFTDGSYINVYYSKVDTEKTYNIRLYYNDNEMAQGDCKTLDGKSHDKLPITVKADDGNTYQVQVANMVDLYEPYRDENVDSALKTTYPGAYELLKNKAKAQNKEGAIVSYNSVPYPEYVVVNVNNVPYCTKDGILYIPDKDNQLFKGNYVHFTYHKDSTPYPGYDKLENYDQEYKKAHNKDGSGIHDPYADYNTVWYYKWGVSTPSLAKNLDYVVTLHWYQDVYVTYKIGDDSCSNHGHNHKYVAQSVVPIGCDSFASTVPAGQEVVWYEDMALTQKAPETKKITQNTYIYGRFEKKLLTHHKYAYYELANSLVVEADGTTKLATDEEIQNPALLAAGAKIVDYISEQYLNYNGNGLITGLEKGETKQDTFDIIDEYGNKKEGIKTQTSYYYNKELVLVDHSYSVLSDTAVALSVDEFPSVEGFRFDSTNQLNQTRGYCSDEPVSLGVAFARMKSDLILDYNYRDENVKKTFSYALGHKMKLPNVTRIGYAFDGWEVREMLPKDDGSFELGEQLVYPVDEDGMVVLTMPNKNLYAKAKWVPASICGNGNDQMITHYFQNPTHSYEKDRMEAIKRVSTFKETEVSIRFQNITQKGSAYYDKEGGTLLGVSIDKEHETIYFMPVEKVNGIYSVTNHELFAMSQAPASTLKSEDFVEVSQYLCKDYDTYQFESMVYQYQHEMQIYKADQLHESYQAFVDMQVDYFYNRKDGYLLNLTHRAFDAEQEVEATITGGGSHFYGENVKLDAHTPAGYSFVGWYQASDVLENYKADCEDLHSLPLKSSLSLNSVNQIINKENGDAIVEPVFAEETHEFAIFDQHLDYVAVFSTEKIQQPLIQITGESEFDYGYHSTAANAMKASVSNMDKNTVVSRYTWYEYYSKDETIPKDALYRELEDGSKDYYHEIAGVKSGTYLFPEGRGAGEYRFFCQADFKRLDNGKTTNAISEDLVVNVRPGEIQATVKNYTGIYDNLDHAMTVSVKLAQGEEESNYEIYYSETKLTKENYQDSKISFKDAIAKRNVKMNADASAVSSYKIYYYVHCVNGNYEDLAGEGYIEILPITVTLSVRASSNAFEKIYDGSEMISGTVSDNTSDKARIANDDYLEIQGLLDEHKEKGHRIIDFDGKFNSAHVDDANVLNLSNIKVVLPNGVVDYNYQLEKDYEVDLSAYIEPKELVVTWGEDTFVYNGTQQAPEMKLAEDQGYSEEMKKEISFQASGAQTNVGSYTARAGVNTTGKSYYASDYVFAPSCEEKKYVIKPCAIVIVPMDKETIYNQKEQTLDTFKIYQNEKPFTLFAGETCKVDTDNSYIDAGTYTVCAQNAQIKNDKGINVTANYDITYGDAKLTILKRKITVSGITAKDKQFDSKKDAELDFSNMSIGNAVLGDAVSIDTSKIVGEFEQVEVGENCAVTLSYDDSCIDGDSKDNYTLSEACQKTTSAHIYKSVLHISPKDVTVVYGENAKFDAFYKDYLGRPLSGSFCDGTFTYQVIKKGATSKDDQIVGEFESDLSLNGPVVADVGEYEIRIKQEHSLTSGNYDMISIDEKVAAKLTVVKRPVSISERAIHDTITKVYDGTKDAHGKTTAQVTNSSYEFTKITETVGDTKREVSASGVLEKDKANLDLVSFTAAYKGADVQTENQEILVENMKLNLSNNYELVDSTFALKNVAISKKPVSVKADSKAITYGDNAPIYTASYTGILKDEKAENLPPTQLLKFQCAYENVKEAENRCVKKDGYPITVSINSSCDYDGNYQVTVDETPAKLTVNKATITLKADNQTHTYGNTVFAKNTYQYAAGDLKYEENLEALLALENAEIGYSYKDSKNANIDIDRTTVVGSYAIVPACIKNDEKSELDNYKFVYQNGTLTIQKAEKMSVQVHAVSSREYDATTNVKPEQITVDLSNLYDVDEAYVKAQLNVSELTDLPYSEVNKKLGIVITANYESKDVNASGTNVSCQVSIQDNTYFGNRYQMKETEKTQTVVSHITQKDLEVSATGKNIYYYQDEVYSIAYKGFAGKEDISTSDVKVPTTIQYITEPNYVKGSAVGTYSVKPDLSGFESNNYHLIAKANDFSVDKNTLTAPNPVWSDSEPGKVSWNAVDAIGVVSANSYSVELICEKDGVKTTLDIGAKGSVTAKVGDSSYELDFSSEIHAQGAGAYSVKVTANSSDLDKVNSKEGTTKKPLYAAKVKFDFASDALSQAGKVENSNLIANKPELSDARRDEGKSYIMIAGEKDIPLEAKLANKGYIVKTITSSNSKLTFGQPQFDDMQNKYENVCEMDRSLASSGDITISLVLNAHGVGVDATIDPTTITDYAYGYLTEEAPVFTVKPFVKPGFECEPGYQYIFEYKWRIYEGISYRDVLPTDGVIESNDGSENPEDAKSVFTVKKTPDLRAMKANYRVCCYVYATRTDNGMTNKQDSQQVLKEGRFNVVRAAVSGAKVVMKGTAGVENTPYTGWTYGEQRNLPEVSRNPGNAPYSKVFFMPAGEYIDEKTSLPAIPQSVQDQEAQASYPQWDQAMFNANGTSGWLDEVPTNAGIYKVVAAVGSTKNYEAYYSAVTQIEIKKNQLKKPTVSGNGMIASEYAPYGIAKWGQVPTIYENANNLPKSKAEPVYVVKLYRKAQGESEFSLYATFDESNETDRSRFTRDSLTKTATCKLTDQLLKGGLGSYYFTVQAKADNQYIGTDAVITQNVNDSLIAQSEQMKMDISLTVSGSGVTDSAEKAEKIYDGGAITLSVPEGFSSYKWYRNGKELVGETSHEINLCYVEDSASYVCEVASDADSYTVFKNIVIKPRKITLTSAEHSKMYDGLPLTILPYEYSVTDADSTFTATELAEDPTVGVSNTAVSGDIVKTSVNGTITKFGTKNVTFSYVNIYHGDKCVYSDDPTQKEAEKNNYEVTFTAKKLTITKRPITICSKDATKVFDHTELTEKSVPTIVNGENMETLATGDSISATFTGAVKHVSYTSSDRVNADESNLASFDNAYKNVVIHNADGEDVTGCYEITTQYGKLTIKPRGEDLSADAKDRANFNVIVSDGTKEYESKNSEAMVFDWNSNRVGLQIAIDDESILSGKVAYQLTEGKDYEIVTDATSTVNEIQVGTYQTRILFKGDFKGEKTITWSIKDLHAPTGSIEILKSSWVNEFFQTITFHLFGKPKQTVCIKTQEEHGGSGVKSISYYKAASSSTSLSATVPSKSVDEIKAFYENSPEAWDEILAENAQIEGTDANGEKIYKTTFDIEDDYKGIVYVRFEDMAGNVRYLSSDGFVLETVPPVCSISQNDVTYCLEKNIIVEDDYLKSVIIKDTNGTVIKHADVDASKSEDKITTSAFSYDLKPSSQAYTIIATDRAGNETTVSNIKVNPTHTWVYAVNTDMDELTATCALDTCSLHNADNLKVQIDADSVDYDATKHTARVYRSDSFKQNLGGLVGNAKESDADSQISVDYFKTTKADMISDGVKLNGAPDHAGYYYAVVSIEAVSGAKETIKKAFEIRKIPLTSLVITDSEATLVNKADQEYYEYPYTDAETGPNADGKAAYKVEAVVDANNATLSEMTDYSIVEEGTNICSKATEVGEYVLKAIAKEDSNYYGQVTANYVITDQAKPVVENVENGKNYCKTQTILVKDYNLKSIEIRKEVDGGISEIFYQKDDFYNTRMKTSGSIELPGSDLGTVYTIVATDISGNTNETMKITVFKDHQFDNYVQDAEMTDKKNAYCEHNCGEVDEVFHTKASVHWNYSYSYTLADGTVNSGPQNKSERATYAEVILKQDGVEVARTYLDCEDICGMHAENAAIEATKEYVFNVFDQTTTLLPYYKIVNGEKERYIYTVEFKSLAKHGDIFVDETEYTGSPTYDETHNVHKISYTYNPDCFSVPWRVELTQLPEVNGIPIIPNTVYVKVLYATEMSDKDAQYNIITQHISDDEVGVPCEVQTVVDPNGETHYIYEGEYPVWKYQANRNGESYYHGIQVVGYQYIHDGVYYYVKAENYRSTEDAYLQDAISNRNYQEFKDYKVRYDADHDSASGVILYELPKIKMPAVLLHLNLGEDDSVNTAKQQAGHSDLLFMHDFSSTVTKSQLEACNPTRDNYEFLGWYDEPGIYAVNGAHEAGVYQINADGSIGKNLLTQVTEIDTPVENVRHLYANWREVAEPSCEIQITDVQNVFKEFLNTISFGFVFNKTQTIKITALDETLLPDGNADYMNRGVEKVEYVLSETPLSKDALEAFTSEWKLYKAPFGLDPEKRFIVYVKVTDKAGNVNYASTEGIILETVVPTISQVQPDTIYCLKKNVTVSDNNLDQVEISYVEADDDGALNGTTQVSDSATRITYLQDKNLFASKTTTAHYKLEAGEKDRIYTVKAIDKAGNSKEINGIRINKVHTFTYTVNTDQNELNAICAIDSCDQYHNATDLTVKVSAEDVIYNEMDHEAQKQVSSGFENAVAGNVSAFTYYQVSAAGAISGGTQLADVPVNVGNYYACLTVTSTTGEQKQLKVPYSIQVAELTSITIEDSVLDYTGSAVGPRKIKVIANLMVNGQPFERELTAGQDYVITENPENKKVSSAVRAGVYTIEVTGIGNYTGVLSDSYEIRDHDAPHIIGVHNKGIYCKEVKVSVSDNNLQSVTITKKVIDENGVASSDIPVDEKTNLINQYQKQLVGSEYGTEYHIVARDVTGNETICSITVFADHLFTEYEPNIEIADQKVADCDHNCGEIDEAFHTDALVEWQYDYSYTQEDGTINEDGVQSKEERATYASVVLKQDGVEIAKTYLDCEAECGATSLDAVNRATKECSFGDTTVLPYYKIVDGEKVKHVYTVEFASLAKHGSDYTTNTEYFGDPSYDEITNLHKVIFTYNPECFMVPWRVELTSLPECNGKTVVPSDLYVKVLYATDVNSKDNGYKVITQQQSEKVHGTECKVKIETGADGREHYFYEGEYPVWKYQANKNGESYYHGIWVVGYQLETAGTFYPLVSENYRSTDDNYLQNAITQKQYREY